MAGVNAHAMPAIFSGFERTIHHTGIEKRSSLVTGQQWGIFVNGRKLERANLPV